MLEKAADDCEPTEKWRAYKATGKVFQLVLRFGDEPDSDSVRCYSILVETKHGYFD